MMGEVKDLIESSVRSWNAHDRGRWTADFADDVELTATGGLNGSGPELIDQFYCLWQDGFPDCQVDRAVISEDGENGMIQAVFKGTHTRPLNAPSDTIPETGRAVEIPFEVELRVEGGKFVSFHLCPRRVDR